MHPKVAECLVALGVGTLVLHALRRLMQVKGRIRRRPEEGEDEEEKEVEQRLEIEERLARDNQGPLQSLSLSSCRATRIPPFVFSREFDLGASLLSLDLSRNMLSELPDSLAGLTLLRELNVSRNFLKHLAPALGQLSDLGKLDASSNDLRPSTLALEALGSLAKLQVLDLRHNNRIHHADHASAISSALPRVEECLVTVRVSATQKLHAADRDASELQSQLEPYSTGTLRRRLAVAFGDTTDPAAVDRAQVMKRLLEHYASWGPRVVRRVGGDPVSPEVCAALLAELEAWAVDAPRERPTIKAQKYMILTNPRGFSSPTGRNAVQGAAKLQKHRNLWALARKAMLEVDPSFAELYTAVAFTKNFEGSPHIDTQNSGPFYGLALGDFSCPEGGSEGGPEGGAEGGGALCVECSAREVAHVDTRGKLGRVDGRYPHWVSPYQGTRFSVIYYQTLGERASRTTAVFKGEPLVDDPPTHPATNLDNYYNKYCRETNTYNPDS